MYTKKLTSIRSTHELEDLGEKLAEKTRLKKAQIDEIAIIEFYEDPNHHIMPALLEKTPGNWKKNVISRPVKRNIYLSKDIECKIRELEKELGQNQSIIIFQALLNYITRECVRYGIPIE